jgi:hypothetical protein
MAHPVRGTQTLVDQMGWVFSHPLFTMLEVGWRWIFGVPFLIVCWLQAQQIAAAVPPESAGLNNLDTQNPWVAVLQLGNVWTHYQPHVAAVFYWLAPSAALVWVVVSGLGRGLVLARLEPGVRFRPVAMILFQAGWLGLLTLTLWGWLGCIQWVAATHIFPNGEADLIGYSIWAIFLTLGFYTLWALISWPLTIAPLLVLLEERSAAASFVESLKLGKAFTGKLMEINLVMGIVKLMLIVLAMVFSAAPLPFSDQLGPGALRVVTACSAIFYLVSSDYFQVVRLKSFIEFWHTFRGQPAH